jgi:mRNA interferase MazF
VTRGEVWWYEPPDDKRRPYLILSRDAVLPLVSRVLAVPATTQVRSIPTEVVLDQSDGMPQPCVLTLDNLEPITKAYCTDRITLLGPERLGEICRALQIAVDC